MSETDGDQRNDFADTKWILAQTHQVLEDARQRLRQMHKGMNDARSWLALVEGFQQGRREGLDRQGHGRGEALRTFAEACEDAVEASRGVDRRIVRAVANVKAAVVMVDGMHTGSLREEIDTGRLRRQLTSLRDDLETTRPLLWHITERLGTEAERARQSVVRPDRHRDWPDVAVSRVCGVLLAADTGNRRVGQELRRAQEVTTQASGGGDVICEAARERMRAHREPPSSSSTGPPMPR